MIKKNTIGTIFYLDKNEKEIKLCDLGFESFGDAFYYGGKIYARKF